MAKSRRRETRDRFNRILTSGSVGGIIGLGLAAIFLVTIGAIVASIFHVNVKEKGDLSLLDATWEVLQRAIDPGQLDSEPLWASRLLLLAVTLIGILLVSTLISIVNSTIERNIERLRRGRGPVHAEDHIVVLGWNALGTKVIEELAEACHDGERFEVVILSDKDPVEVQREIQEDLRRRRSVPSNSPIVRKPESWLTVRRGNLRNVADLAQFARLSKAKSVLILSHDHSDAETAMVILAIIAGIQGPELTRTTPVNIIAKFDDTHFGEQLQERIHRLSIESTKIGDKEPIAELFPVTPAMVRTGIESQVARHRGLSEVYRDLLDFDGDEIYLIPSPTNFTNFGEIVCSDEVIPLGIKRHKEINLWPEWDTSISGAEIIVLAKSESIARQKLSDGGDITPTGPRPVGNRRKTSPEELLIVGWNKDAPVLAQSLRHTSPPGSRIEVLASREGTVAASLISRLDLEVRVRDRQDDPLDDRHFIEKFDHVIVLADEDIDPTESDAAVLTDVLACRINISESDLRKDQPTTVVAELRQSVSKYIAGARLADDLLLSDSLGASAMVQLAVNPSLLPVLSALLESDSLFDPKLMSLGADSERFVGRSWKEIRRQIVEETGELAVAIRGKDANGKVRVNPPSKDVLESHEEIIVFGRQAASPSRIAG